MPTDTNEVQPPRPERFADRLVTIEDFKAVDFQQPIAGLRRVNSLPLQTAYLRAAEAAHVTRNEPAFQVFRLLYTFWSFHLRTEDPAHAFGPQFEAGEKRSPVPDDFRGEQIEILLQLLPRVDHPALRARLADAIWVTDRRQAVAGRAAVDGYRKAAEGLLNGTFDPEYSGAPHIFMEMVEQLQRAYAIANRLHKRGYLPEDLNAVFHQCWAETERAAEPVPFAHLGQLALRFELVDAKELAARAEAVAAAAGARPKVYQLAVKAVWDLAAAAHGRAGDVTAQTRCQLLGVDATLAMQDEVSGALAKASWIRTAITELREIPGTKERQAELTAQLRALQDRSAEDMGLISTPIDLQGQVLSAKEAAEGFSPSEALFQFALVAVPRPMAELRAQALEIARQTPLAAMMSHQILDDEGKVVAEIPGAPFEGDPSEEWFHWNIEQHERLRRQIVITGSLEPARRIVNARYNFCERYFRPVVDQSPFVPPYHRGNFLLGFTRLFQGDFASASHLLIPQLENSVRHVLGLSGRDPSKLMGNMRQDDRSLSAILEYMRDDMLAIFDSENTEEIDRLFNRRPGPALRHEFAHGKVSYGECFQPNVIYGCWYIYHLCCLPLLNDWEQRVAPGINAQL